MSINLCIFCLLSHLIEFMFTMRLVFLHISWFNKFWIVRFLALRVSLIDTLCNPNYCNVHYCCCLSCSHPKCSHLLNTLLVGFLLLQEDYLTAVPLRGRRGWGALVNRCGGLVDWRGTPLLGAYGAALEATLVLLVRHGGHHSAPWTSLSTEPCRSGTSSSTSLLPAAHLKHKCQEVTRFHPLIFPRCMDRNEHLFLSNAFRTILPLFQSAYPTNGCWLATPQASL